MRLEQIVGSSLMGYLHKLLALSPTSIFSTTSTPADKVRLLSYNVLFTLGGVYLAVTALLVYALVRYTARRGDDTEPPQVFGSTQIELSWTIIPTLIIVVLFLGTARVVFEVQDAPQPKTALDVTVVGHQFWWEFRYPGYGVVTANELHIPLSDPNHPTPTYMKLTSADVIHSFWVPSLAGKTDLVPNRINEMWVDPHQAGVFEGQCAQFCGTQHAKMLLRVYVDTPQQFQQWIAQQQTHAQPPDSSSAASLPAGSHQVNALEPSQPGATPMSGNSANLADRALETRQINAEAGRRVFEQQACVSCHAIQGTVANGRFGPDLTHLMSRTTIASGIAPNTPAALLAWIEDPSDMKPGALMPAMHLTPLQNKQITAYLITLR